MSHEYAAVSCVVKAPSSVVWTEIVFAVVMPSLASKERVDGDTVHRVLVLVI